MSMSHQEPHRFKEQNEPLDNFSDLSNRVKIREKGLFSENIPHQVKILVSINSIDDLVQVMEQDYYLNRFIAPKLIYISEEKDIFDATCRLVETYMSVNHIDSIEASQVKTFVLSNLNLI